MTQVRRVRRIIRKFDAWTVFKVSAVVWSVGAIGFVLGLVMFWSVLVASGIPQKLTDVLITITLLEAGDAPFSNTDQFVRVAMYGAVVFAVVGTGFTTLMAIIYNLVSDVVGGIEIVVLEETLVVGPVTGMVQQTRPIPTSSPASGHDIPTEEHPTVATR